MALAKLLRDRTRNEDQISRTISFCILNNCSLHYMDQHKSDRQGGATAAAVASSYSP